VANKVNLSILKINWATLVALGASQGVVNMYPAAGKTNPMFTGVNTVLIPNKNSTTGALVTAINAQLNNNGNFPAITAAQIGTTDYIGLVSLDKSGSVDNTGYHMDITVYGGADIAGAVTIDSVNEIYANYIAATGATITEADEVMAFVKGALAGAAVHKLLN